MSIKDGLFPPQKKAHATYYCTRYYQPKGALESQDTSSQDWLEQVYRDRKALPLFLPESEDDLVPPGPPRDHSSNNGYDSDKENEPPLRVPLLPWSQRRRLAGILTRIAFGHESMSSAVLELRDAVLDGGLFGEDEGESLQDEHRDPPVAPSPDPADWEKESTGSTTESEAEILEPQVVEPMSCIAGLAAGLAALRNPDNRRVDHADRDAREVRTESQERIRGDSVAAVVTEALNHTKRKIDVVDPSSEKAPEKRQIRRRVVPTPTESQVERDNRRREEYKDANRQRLAEGLSPRRPQRRRVIEPPSQGQTPSTQLIEEILGYNFHGSQAEALQSGFQVRRG